MDLSWVKQASELNFKPSEIQVPQSQRFCLNTILYLALDFWALPFKPILSFHCIYFFKFNSHDFESFLKVRREKNIASFTHSVMQSFPIPLKLSKKTLWLFISGSMAKGVGQVSEGTEFKPNPLPLDVVQALGDERAILLLKPCHSSHLWGSSIHSWTQLLSIGLSCLALYLFNLCEDKERCSTESSFVSLSISSIVERAVPKPQAMVCISFKSSKALSSYAVLCCLFYWVTIALLYTICLFVTWWTTL